MNPVLQSAKYIYGKSESVSIDINKVKEFAKELIATKATTPFNFLDWSSHELNPDLGDENALEWILIVDSLNFSFWSDLEINNEKEYVKKYKYGAIYKDKLYQGYWSLPAVINRALDNNINLLDFKVIQNLSDEEIKSIFYSDYSPIEPYPPLLESRIRVLREISTIMLEKYSGKVQNILIKADNDAIKLMHIIVDSFPCFKDQVEFPETNQLCHIFKRAQILVADIAAYFQFEGQGKMNNLDKITMFADYRVPQTLLKLGILKYNEHLLNILNNGELLLYGSKLELEIRGNSIWSVQLIIEELKNKLNLNAIQIDFYLWEYAQHYKLDNIEYPIHRTRSIYY